MKKLLKILISIIIIVVLLITFASVQFSKTPISSSFTLTSHTNSPQNYIAHRGLSSVYPENSLPAIEGAIENGYYGCEFDIHTTKDNIWILNHDSNIDKMTNGSGDIKDLTYDELIEYNIDNGNGIENYESLKLPKLTEALEIISKSNIVPFIEIKGYNPDAFKILIDTISEYGLSEITVIISFDMEALLGIRKIDKNIKLMYLTNNLTIDDVNACMKNGNIGVNINGGNIFKMKDAIAYSQSHGLETAAWTIDLPIHADLLNLFNIKYITTNRILP